MLKVQFKNFLRGIYFTKFVICEYKSCKYKFTSINMLF